METSLGAASNDQGDPRALGFNTRTPPTAFSFLYSGQKITQELEPTSMERRSVRYHQNRILLLPLSVRVVNGSSSFQAIPCVPSVVRQS